MAAGIVLVREAGGLVGRLEGDDDLLGRGTLIAANPAVYPRLGELLQASRRGCGAPSDAGFDLWWLVPDVSLRFNGLSRGVDACLQAQLPRPAPATVPAQLPAAARGRRRCAGGCARSKPRWEGRAMTSPQRFINRMIIFLVLAAIAVAFAYDIVWRIFLYNPLLNGLILAVLLVGIVYIFRRVFSVKPEMRWIEAFRTSQPGFSLQAAPRLLAPVAGVLGEQERRGRVMLPAMSVRYLLDSISARLDESRDISRYQIGLLIFLGLLGTFWGLLETIGSVSQVINGLSVGEGDLVVVFDELKARARGADGRHGHGVQLVVVRPRRLADPGLSRPAGATRRRTASTTRWRSGSRA